MRLTIGQRAAIVQLTATWNTPTWWTPTHVPPYGQIKVFGEGRAQGARVARDGEILAEFDCV